MKMYKIALPIVLAGSLLALTAWAAGPKKEPLGRWSYKVDTRTVKVVIIGGSIANWKAGNFGHFLETVCSNIEIKNRAQTGYGAPKLKHRFKRQFLQNPRVKLADERFEYWLMYNGGLNSIFSPEMTIKFTSELFAKAHKKGVRVAALTLTPWGSDRDKRWHDFDGLDYYDKTRKVVDFVLGKLQRNQALGRYAKEEDKALSEWKEGELPDIGINLYDSPLRNSDVTPRDPARLTRIFQRSRKLKKRYPNAQQAIERASRVPLWYMKPTFRAFDHIHPNSRGHREIAKRTCPLLPQSWGCSCPRLEELEWRKGKVLPIEK
ncbi:MAG TPA: hypothetical protein EYN06_03725 [Myxococcales bacterium]|nr:hypothetical protein [Myxococcales bacterium]HIN85568.1 hypothetical protein [Myxococcales bacterium]